MKFLSLAVLSLCISSFAKAEMLTQTFCLEQATSTPLSCDQVANPNCIKFCAPIGNYEVQIDYKKFPQGDWMGKSTPIDLCGVKVQLFVMGPGVIAADFDSDKSNVILQRVAGNFPMFDYSYVSGENQIILRFGKQ